MRNERGIQPALSYSDFAAVTARGSTRATRICCSTIDSAIATAALTKNSTVVNGVCST